MTGLFIFYLVLLGITLVGFIGALFIKLHKSRKVKGRTYEKKN